MKLEVLMIFAAAMVVFALGWPQRALFGAKLNSEKWFRARSAVLAGGLAILASIDSLALFVVGSVIAAVAYTRYAPVMILGLVDKSQTVTLMMIAYIGSAVGAYAIYSSAWLAICFAILGIVLFFKKLDLAEFGFGFSFRRGEALPS